MLLILRKKVAIQHLLLLCYKDLNSLSHLLVLLLFCQRSSFNWSAVLLFVRVVHVSLYGSLGQLTNSRSTHADV